MNIALLGYGKEGQAAEKYFKSHHQDAKITIFQDFDPTEIKNQDFSDYDLIIRSPSVPPLNLPHESSLTKYFFDHCPCKIIGVTATKGKGTTCSFIKSLLDTFGKDAHLVGNIGNPAIDVLDQLKKDSVVIYEMSSFQLWDLKKSPSIAVIGQLEPDHLNVHRDYQDYLSAKANITKYQTSDDYLIYYSKNPETIKIAETSKAKKVPYPFEIPDSIKNSIKLPGQHNQENAIAAIAAVASLEQLSPEEFMAEKSEIIAKGLEDFKGLPHRLEFIGEIDGIKYYDDNFSTNPSSTRVAVNAFPDSEVTIIVGGRDKTDNADLPEIYEILQSPQIKNIILLGESGHELRNRYQDTRFQLANSLKQAIELATKSAHSSASKSSEKIILMSPAAASFDMFKNVYDRGAKYQALLKELLKKT